MANWNKRFIDLASHISNWSKDTTKVGAVIVDSSNKVLSTGYNGMPSWFNDDNLLNLQENKGLVITHAEINALNCLDKSHFNKDLSIYITKPPCYHCALSIVNSYCNITKVFYIPFENESFNDRYKVQDSVNLLIENNVKVTQL